MILAVLPSMIFSQTCLRDRRIELVRALDDLGFGDGGRGVRHHLDDPVVPGPSQAERSDEEEVAGDQRLLHAVLLVGGLSSPPYLAEVVDVVVYQGGRMDELEGRRQVDDVLALLAPDRLVRKKRHSRTDPLSTCSDHMAADVGQQVLFAIDAAADASLDLLQFLRYRGVPGHFIAIIIVRCYLTLSDNRRGRLSMDGQHRPASAVSSAVPVTGTEKGLRRT